MIIDSAAAIQALQQQIAQSHSTGSDNAINGIFVIIGVLMTIGVGYLIGLQRQQGKKIETISGIMVEFIAIQKEINSHVGERINEKYTENKNSLIGVDKSHEKNHKRLNMIESFLTELSVAIAAVYHKLEMKVEFEIYKRDINL